jgi:lipopolysaccharide/colanic/teichoic acid biosynthesis glycosyltransferase
MAGDVAKRLIDVAASLVGLFVISPILVTVGALIKLDSPGPVLHLAQRVGKGGRPFRLYKFRSMVVDAHRDGPGITPAGDRRITRVGRLLRRTKLDELPQLFNVLKGDMSLVGPRPEDPRYVRLYTAAQREVLRVRPGVTSAASLVYRHESSLLSGGDWEKRYVDEILPHKLGIELDYLAHRTVVSDLALVLRTLLALPSGRAITRTPDDHSPVSNESGTADRRLVERK